MHAALKLIEPSSEPVPGPIEMQQAGPCAVNQQASRVTIASLADTQQHGFPASRMLTRNEPEPSSEISSFPKLAGIASGSDQGRGPKGANSWNRHEPASPFIFGSEGLNVTGHILDAGFESREVFEQILKQLPHRWGEIILRLRNNPRKVDLKGASTLPDGNAILETE